jgi:hypothetical protein
MVSAQAKSYDNPDTLFVSRDGTCEFRNVADAIEVCRAFMEYHKVIFVKKGTYKEKLVIPQWLTNIEICGEDRDKTIITWDDHANIRADITPLTAKGEAQKIGTFRTFTMKIEGNNIFFAMPFHGPMAMLSEFLSKTHYNKTNSIFVTCEVNDDNTMLTATFYSKEFKLFTDF